MQIKFQGVEQELTECEALVQEADKLSASVSTLPGVADMVAEYRALYTDVRTRLDVARAEIVRDVDSAVQVRIFYKGRKKNKLPFLSNMSSTCHVPSQ